MLDPPQRVEAIYGGVDLKAIREAHPSGRNYDGCFVGRLHPQKGPIELIRIWSIVCSSKPDATLAVIGSGPIEQNVRDEIQKLGLQDRVDMLGWVEGSRKYEILKSSKVFLHTPVQDTGGMAAAEAMACGLPVVGFNLPGYKFAFPSGILTAPVGDEAAFAELVLRLLEEDGLYRRVKAEALEYSLKWDWDTKALEILKDIESAPTRGTGEE